jgi:hypothetical protein
MVADIVLVLHFSIVLFVVAGLVLVLAGNHLGWAWVNRLWFRLAHLAAIGVVVAEAWLGITCPLTTLEFWLRREAGAVFHQQGFIEYWVQRLLYYDAPAWVFISAYTGFGLLVLATWFVYPPDGGRRPPRQ